MEWIAVVFSLVLGFFIGWKYGSRAVTALNARVSALTSELAVKTEASEREKAMLAESAAKEIALLRDASEKNAAAERENTKRLLAEQEKAMALKLDLIKAEFKALSERIFTEKSDQMKKENNQQIEQLLKPLREKMAEFKQSVDASREKGIEQSARLSEQIQKMLDEARKLGTEADSLAAALKGEQKTQGNWGEMLLDDILSRSGLQENVHYENQPTICGADGRPLKTDENKMLRPDVIVHYPDGRDVIIDSKVSLTAYLDYMNADSDEERNAALSRHIASVRKHVEELAAKNYASFLKNSGRETMDLVLMFIPNESPYQLAMTGDPGLWQKAFDRKVVIVSPVNLIALLQLIRMAWVKAEQDRNQEEILKYAGQMLDRIYAFYEDFDEIGRQLEKTEQIYGSAVKRLKQSARGHSVVNSGEKLRKLGVKLTKAQKLPARLEISPEDDPAGLPLPEEAGEAAE
ncbi:MAG: DNA recombination protein RmuC [Lentisphaeria bacterium]|nr:DNA recombination protein RmuC [Lentisphaeria bacterium]